MGNSWHVVHLPHLEDMADYMGVFRKRIESVFKNEGEGVAVLSEGISHLKYHFSPEAVKYIAAMLMEYEGTPCPDPKLTPTTGFLAGDDTILYSLKY